MYDVIEFYSCLGYDEGTNFEISYKGNKNFLSSFINWWD